MTLAAITMTAPEAASPVQMYRATYSPDDNKLRLFWCPAETGIMHFFIRFLVKT